VFIGYYSEMPFSTFPLDEARKRHPDDHPARLANDVAVLFSNRFYDPAEAARLYADRFEEYRYADELGVDGVMAIEHHNIPYCLQTRINITSAILAATTKKAKILQMGNPLPLWDNPVTMAEEVAMIDLISGGRVIAGMLRGIGYEQIATNTNPAYNRERFVEAHDLIVRTWTEPGPFRWEGEHYQFRVVNPWALPLQQPHPRIWIPGIASIETITFAAQHGYPYLGLGPSVEETRKIIDTYDTIAREAGFEPGTEHHGAVVRVHVAETEEKALRNAKEFLWMMEDDIIGPFHPVFWTPSGYSSREAIKVTRTRGANFRQSLEAQLESGRIIAGTPEQVVDRFRYMLERTRLGIVSMWAHDGRIGHDDAMTCVRLLGEEVWPALREIADELELKSPFEADSPVSLATGRTATLAATG